MKHIKTINFITGKERIASVDEFFMNRIKAEIEHCVNTIREYPDIGTVKDGSRFAMQKILESIERKAENISDKEAIFATFYEDILSDKKAIKEICDNTKDISTKCVLLGQIQGYDFAIDLIKRLNKVEPIEYEENETNEKEIEKTIFDKNGCPVNCPCIEDYPDCYCCKITKENEEE